MSPFKRGIPALARILLTISVCIFSSSLAATTYFVDYDSGLDTGLGSQQAPWKHVPGMDGWYGTAVLRPADVLCFKGGVTWPRRLMITPTVAGTSDSVMYKGDCAGWGVGRAIISVPASEAAGTAILVKQRDNIVLEGFVVALSSATNALWHCAIYVEGASWDYVVGFVVRNLEIKNSPSGLHLLNYVVSATVVGLDSHDNSFPDATRPRVSSGIHISGAANVSITNSRLYRNGATTLNTLGLNEGRGITISGGVTPSTNISIADNLIWDNGSPLGDEGTGIEGADATFVTLNGNQVINGATAAELKRGCNNWTITNNTFFGRSSGVFQYGYYGGFHSTLSRIENNTIVSLVNCRSAAMKISSPNNIVRNNTILLPDCNDSGGLELNNTSTNWAFSTYDFNLSNNKVIGKKNQLITVTFGPAFKQYPVDAWQLAYPNQN